MSDGKKHVFISHSAKDDSMGRRVLAALEEQGLTCWYSSRPTDLEPGAYWDANIGLALDGSAAVVCILSAASNESKWVWRELAMANDRDLPILPIRIENVRPKGGLEPYLVRTQFVDALTEPIEEHVLQAVPRLHALLERETKQIPRPRTTAESNEQIVARSTSHPPAARSSQARAPLTRLFAESASGHRSPGSSRQQGHGDVEATADLAVAPKREFQLKQVLAGKGVIFGLMVSSAAIVIVLLVIWQYVLVPAREDVRKVETRTPPSVPQINISSARLRRENGDVFVDLLVQKIGFGDLTGCYIKRKGINYDTALNLLPLAFPSERSELQFTVRSDVPGPVRVTFECSGVSSGPVDAS